MTRQNRSDFVSAILSLIMATALIMGAIFFQSLGYRSVASAEEGSPVWVSDTGEGLSFPACASAGVGAPTCSGVGVAQVTITVPGDNEGDGLAPTGYFSCGTYGATATLSSGQTQFQGFCPDGNNYSFTFPSLTPSTAYSYTVTGTVVHYDPNFFYYYVTTEVVNGSFTTPNCPPPQPDLIISIAPNLNSGSLTFGSSLTFKGTVKNSGTATATPAFTNRFQIDLGNNGSYDVTLSPHPSISSLGASLSQVVTSGSWTATIGTHRVRLCADSPTSVVAESSESNNCQSSSLITIPSPIPTASLSASPTEVAVGGSATLAWNSTNATSCAGTGFSTGGAPSGSASTGSLTTVGPHNYQVVCSGPGGTSAPSFATVEVLPPNVTINADPARVVSSGNSTTISWSATGVNSCTVTGPGVSTTTSSGSQAVTVSAQSTYTITCDSLSDSVTVNITSDFDEF